jgi:hypothetical protein
VHLVVNSGSLRRVKVTTTHVLMVTIALFSIMVVYMVIDSAINTQELGIYTTESITGQITNHFYCTDENASVDLPLYFFEAMIILLSAKLSYDTKNVPDAINEAALVASGIHIFIYI